MQFMRNYVTVDLDAVCANMRLLRRHAPAQTALMAVIKADGYGHGAVAIGKVLEEGALADMFAVATVEEGVELRRAGIRKPILLLGYTSPRQTDDLFENDLIPTVYRLDTAAAFSAAAREKDRTLPVHIALDTGMGRIGFPADREGINAIASVAALPALRLDGVFSHFAAADEDDLTFSYEQSARFDAVLSALRQRGIRVPHPHLCNSAGMVVFPEREDSLVRCGIVLYGLYPSDTVRRALPGLQPVMSWKTCVSHLKTVPRGTPVSYGSTWIAERETILATLPVGYADGYPRSLSNRGSVLIRGQRAPICGRVCMDQMMVDVTDIPGVCMEDPVTLVGKDGESEISMEEIGQLSGRFHYEFPCMISKRVPRVYLQR